MAEVPIRVVQNFNWPPLEPKPRFASNEDFLIKPEG
jgi:hypothetical protein